jgi:5-(carboxyamino)imidazole ribonucleotide mutase
MHPKVMIMLGSASDFKIAKKATEILEKLEICYDLKVASAHRTHERVRQVVSRSTNDGVDVFIGIAGLSAHLPGIIAANTHKPVIGVPVEVKLGGLDALFASIQMPFGAPVACVGVDRGENAAILAAQIIGIHNASVRDRLSALRKEFYFKIDADEETLSAKLNGSFYHKMSFNSLDEYKFDDVNLVNLDQDMHKLKSPQVAVISGSYSDIKVAKKTTMFLDKLKITYDSAVVSPIRSPDKFENFMKKNKDAKLYMAISGLSAHVTGAVVAYTEKPVIGVPCAIQLDGIDALLSMVNMPPGVPVATLGIGAGGNAALLAAEMLGISDIRINDDLLNFKGKINCKR